MSKKITALAIVSFLLYMQEEELNMELQPLSIRERVLGNIMHKQICIHINENHVNYYYWQQI